MRILYSGFKICLKPGKKWLRFQSQLLETIRTAITSEAWEEMAEVSEDVRLVRLPGLPSEAWEEMVDKE